ncbi:MAG: radical SAM protein [Caldilineales bacterium]
MLTTTIPLFETVNATAPATTRDFPACDAEFSVGDAFDHLLGGFDQAHVPYMGLLELTHKCNLDCVMCYNVPLAQPELTTAEWLDVLEQMAEAGTLRLTLSGGEILTRRDFFTIAGHARTLDFALDLKTNATLITPESADRIAALQPVQVDISLLGASDSTFDAVAGSKNTFTRVLRGVQLLQARGVAVKLNTLLLNLNVHERSQMVDLARTLGVEYKHVVKLSRSDDGQEKAGNTQLSTDAITRVLEDNRADFAVQAPTAETRTCKVGLSSFLISPYGEIYPCQELRISAGNLRRQSFGSIWRDAPIFQELRSRHTYANFPECRVCPINAYCVGRCSGLAWKRDGNLYGADLTACAQAQAHYQQRNPGQLAPLTPLQAKQRRHYSANGNPA